MAASRAGAYDRESASMTSQLASMGRMRAVAESGWAV